MSTAYTCPCAAYPTLEKTFERYPERWYENTRLLLLVAAVLTAILVFLQSRLSIPVSPGAWASILGVSGWIGVWLADVYSTGRIGEMKVKFDRRGLEPFGEERNPLLPPYPTWGDLMVNWTNAASLGLCVLFWFLPLLAVISIVFRGGIALANLRTLRRLKLALEWIDRETTDRGLRGR
jgi:hypothetical protein